MLTSEEMALALRAVNQIDERSLLVITLKLIDDIKTGQYSDGHTLTSRICVGDLLVHPDWWLSAEFITILVAVAAGNLVRIVCHAVGVNPMQGEWRQLLVLCTATSYIEEQVAVKLLMTKPQVFSA